MRRNCSTSAIGVVAIVLLAGCAGSPTRTSGARVVPVTFTGGFELGANDFGRPVPLYASMLGVSAAVFRQAFSGVRPNAAHAPTGAEQQRNKAALLAVLAKYGVSNDEMDRVANYYRFDSTKGQTWPLRVARAEATIVRGAVESIRITDPGVGYTAAPHVTVPGFATVSATAHVVFTGAFATNGHIGSITIGDR